MPLRLNRPAASRPEDGASAVEYGLFVAAIAAVIVAIAYALGGITISAFETTCTSVGAKVASTQTCP